MALWDDSMTSFQPALNPSVVQAQSVREPGRAHVLVIGNEKGGSGKSTTALHIAVSLMSDGARVATIDLDARQGTLTRYLENRAAFIKRKAVELPMPVHAAVMASGESADEKARFEAAESPDAITEACIGVGSSTALRLTKAARFSR